MTGKCLIFMPFLFDFDWFHLDDLLKLTLTYTIIESLTPK